MADEDGDAEVNVCVAVRCRPMSGKELAEGSTIIAEFPGNEQVALNGAKGEKHNYAFDHTFAMDSAQESVYKALGVPLLDKAFEGYNSTIFAYGQTGSGKTHTMMSHRAAPEDRGLIPRISDGLYHRIDDLTKEHETRRFLVCVSFLEIYNEIIFDLLVPRAKQAKGGLEVREQKGVGVYVKDLTEMVVESADKLSQLVESGFSHRTTASTKMNEGSSRSHCIFIIKVHQKDANDETKNTFSKLNLVDLAGSERAKSTEAEGDRLKEGANINKSLSALGNVINALSSIAGGNKKVFVPYRNSKLTRVLQESLGGNSLCTMIATMSPSSTNIEETLSTLNYAKRAKTIKVTAQKNDEASQIRKLEDEVEALRKKLASQADGAQVGLNSKEKQEMESKYEAQISELQVFMKQSWEEKQQLSQEHEAQQKKVQDDSRRVAERLANERKKRLEMLVKNGDLQLSLQALIAVGSKLAEGWPDKIADALKLEQTLRAQLRAVKLFRESAGADFAMCIGCKVSDVVAIITLLNQVHSKLNSMNAELTTFGRLEVKLEEQLGYITPEVALALREAQGAAAADSDEGSGNEELVAMIAIVQKQLHEHHVKIRSFIQAERNSLAFPSELKWLLQCLDEDGSNDSGALSELKQALREEVAGRCGGDSKASKAIMKALGLSTFEWQDACLSASSNSEFAKCARLMQSVLYAGWSPEKDSGDEYLEIDLTEEKTVLGVSLQGRLPCTAEWSQTRDLLQVVLRGVSDKLPTSEKVFKRPPVRLIHDVGVALAHEGGCFSGSTGWFVPQELQDYGALGREQKLTFFEELIKNTIEAIAEAVAAGLPPLSVTAQDILSGKNCEETNRFLQILSYLKLHSANLRGVGDLAPQWTKSFKLSYYSGGQWKWFGDGGQAKVLEGNADVSTVKLVRLPEAVSATKLRVFPAEWQRHPALRCEIHVAAEAGSNNEGEGDGSAASLEESVNLACKAILEVKRGIEDRKQARQKEEEEKHLALGAQKDKAEEERDQLERRLKDALARVDELENANSGNESRAGSAETELLKMQVERDRLDAQVEQMTGDLETTTEHKEAVDLQVKAMQDEQVELRTQVDDLQNQLQVASEERDVARQKEEELFDMLGMKEEDLMDTNNGYVYLTERLQEKEEEMERLQEQFDKMQDAHEKMDDRGRELSDEVIKLRGETQGLKQRLSEEERSSKAAQDRYMKLLKDNMSSTASRPDTGQVTPTTAGTQQSDGTAASGGSTKAAGGYEDDFDEEEGT